MITNRSIPCLFVAAFAMTLVLCCATRADDSANPKYLAWAKFKPGSTNTIVAEIKKSDARFQIQVKSTLISVSNDVVVISLKTTITLMGHWSEVDGHPVYIAGKELPADKAVEQTIKAKIDKEEIKQTGEQDVQAMGKTFKCKVFEASGKTDAPAAGGHEVPGSNIEGRKATVYANDDVPGGIVKLETVGADGKTAISFVLTDMQVK